MKKVLSVLLSLGFLGTSFAQVELEGRPEAVSCAQFLIDVLPQVTVGNNQRFHVGNFNELPQLMAQSGTRPDIVIATALMFTQVMGTAPKGHILNEVYDKIQKDKDNESSLLVCVLGTNCKPRYGQALHVAIETNFDIVQFNLSGKPTKFDRLWRVFRKDAKPGWFHGGLDFPGPVIPPAHRSLIVKGGADATLSGWLGNLFHEATHAADFAITWEWIQANLKLISLGRLPDQFFQTFVHVDGPKPQIHEGFFRVLIESRAYLAEAEGMITIAQPLAREIDVFLRRQALKDFRDFGKVTQPIVDSFEITQENVFEIGEELGRQMMETIRKAALIP